MLKLNYHKATFLKSVAKLSQLPRDEGAEIAFVGRSNAGKSSALNALTNQKNLARISKTPGRTQLINLFALDDNHRLVDLPGYGYAKVSENARQKWQYLIDQYLRNRDCLRGLVLLMDIRHPLQPFDQAVLNWASDIHLNIHILLTKSDKISYGAATKTLRQVETALKDFTGDFSVQLFSASKKIGVEQLANKLDEW